VGSASGRHATSQLSQRKDFSAISDSFRLELFVQPACQHPAVGVAILAPLASNGQGTWWVSASEACTHHNAEPETLNLTQIR
jgi:hypothetical protein